MKSKSVGTECWHQGPPIGWRYRQNIFTGTTDYVYDEGQARIDRFNEMERGVAECKELNSKLFGFRSEDS